MANNSNLSKAAQIIFPLLDLDANGMPLLTLKNVNQILPAIKQEDDKVRNSVLKLYANPTKENVELIVRKIAAANSTRTPKDGRNALAHYMFDKDNRFLERLESGEIALIDDLCQYGVIATGKRYKSLASKICRYLNEWIYDGDAYAINDSIVRTVLPYYLHCHGVDRSLWTKHVGNSTRIKNFELMSYKEFFDCYKSLQQTIQGVSLRDLDSLIWYYFSQVGFKINVIKNIIRHTTY